MWEGEGEGGREVRGGGRSVGARLVLQLLSTIGIDQAGNVGGNAISIKITVNLRRYSSLSTTRQLPHCYPKATSNKDIFSVPLFHSNTYQTIAKFQKNSTNKKLLILYFRKNETKSSKGLC